MRSKIAYRFVLATEEFFFKDGNEAALHWQQYFIHWRLVLLTVAIKLKSTMHMYIYIVFQCCWTIPISVKAKYPKSKVRYGKIVNSYRDGFSVRQIGQLPKVKLNALNDLLSSAHPPRIARLMANMHNCVWCEIRWQSHSVDWWASHTTFEQLSRSVTFVFLKCQ